MALVLWPSFNGLPVGDGGPITAIAGEVVVTELGQFSAHRVTLPAANARAILSMSPYTLCELAQTGDGPFGVGTIQYGIVTSPRQAITDRDDHTITIELAPLPAECTWYRTLPEWVAENWLSVIAARLGGLVPGWTFRYTGDAAAPNGGDLPVSVNLNNPTILGGFLATGKQFNRYVRQGVDAAGVPNRTLEMGQFGAPSTTWLTGAHGGDAEAMAGNDLIRLVATVDREPNTVTDLVNVAAPYGGGRDIGSLVTLERLWRIINDPRYVNAGRYGTDAESIARTGKTSVFPEYTDAYPISDPLQPPTGVATYDADGTIRQGGLGTRAFTLTGRGVYLVYDRASYATYGHRAGEFIDSNLNYSDTSVANQETTARALYVSLTTAFKRRAHPHHTFRCTAPGTGRPTRAGDLIAVDVQRVSVGDEGAVVEMDVRETLRVMRVTRSFSGDAPPVDTYVLSNTGRFEDDDATAQASQAATIVALQRNQGTGLAPLPIYGEGNVDALHPLEVPVDIPAQLFRWFACSLRVDFYPYRATAQTALNTAGTPITIPVLHGNHSLDGAFNADGTAVVGTTDGFDYIRTGTETDAAVKLLIENDGGLQPLGQRVNAVLHTGPTRYTLGSGAVPAGTPVEVSAKINFRKQDTKSAFSAPIKKAVQVASILTGTLPQHTHPLDQRIPDGPTAPNVTVAIDGIALSSGLTPTFGSRNADGTFPGSFRLANIGAFVEKPGQTVILHFTPGTATGSNPYGVGYFKVTGTWFGEFGGLTSTIRAS